MSDDPRVNLRFGRCDDEFLFHKAALVKRARRIDGQAVDDYLLDLPFLINDEGGPACDATILHQYAVGFGRGAIGEIAQQGKRQG